MRWIFLNFTLVIFTHLFVSQTQGFLRNKGSRHADTREAVTTLAEVLRRRGKVDAVPERAAAEAEAPALELPAIDFPRDGAAPSPLACAGCARSVLRRASSPPPRRMSPGSDVQYRVLCVSQQFNFPVLTFQYRRRA